ncbi:hypothetical protein IWT140_02308 [Secundilactobacillus pentosiphilus]|uniref:Uncharacterized protein n=1 Tax=Secundilactobacillus pentosiphilus TaxID=1714682 RepID=A0A1Z5ISB6_9LACO|nr:hypothetical protein [Secundilactobacillus pentosiphilus]GAX04665.1 hypothetical protein IWT140_02308 [Secundilactobacillus pentosiphilus]
MNKLKGTIVLLGLSAGVLVGLGFNSSNAEAKSSGTTPTAIRGTFYRYAGHHKWDKLQITTHTATLSGRDYGRGFKITSTSKSSSHRLAYQYHAKKQGRKYFTLQAKLKDGAASAFPEDGMALTKRKIGNHTYKVIRGYQGGSGFDFIKGHKATKDYVHVAYNY